MVSLGCPKNQVDSERALWALRQAGLTPVTEGEDADILLANTCGFIEAAKEESIEAILELARIKDGRPGVRLAVMGCLSERYRDELTAEIPEIDHIYGTANLPDIARDLAPGAANVIPDPDAAPREISAASGWAYLKIAEGCSNKCSFCVIPSIRGAYRSRDKASLIAEAESLAARGVKEIVLVAQDTTLYGADLKHKNGLESLVRGLTEINGIRWIRTLYMYPALVDGSLLDAFAGEEKIVPYFDIPLQHASDRILRTMARPETGASIRQLIEKIRTKIPEAAIRASFILGFPGETDEDFEEVMRLAEEARFDHLGAFVYSPEEGTSAYGMSGAVEKAVAEERLDILMNRQKLISSEIARGKIGAVEDVIVELPDPAEPILTGRLKTQAPEIDGQVILDSVEAAPGEIITVRITGATDYDLVGEAF